MFEDFFAKFGQVREPMNREWLGILEGDVIFNVLSNMLEYNIKVRKRATKRYYLLLMKLGWQETHLI